MILTALDRYYDRLLAQPDTDIAPIGYSYEKISYALVISPSGDLVDVMDLRDTSSKKPRPRSMSVPQPEIRTVGVKPFFLWDKSSYVLGLGDNQETTQKKKEKREARILEEHEAFKAYHKDVLRNTNDDGLLALLAFFNKWSPEKRDEYPKLVDEVLTSNLVFRLDAEQAFIHESEEARTIRSKLLENESAQPGICLVTGENAPLSKLHPKIKGVRDAQSSGASIVSFNLSAFTSYGKSQGENSPVSEKAAFSYTTVLNYLLSGDPSNRQKLQIGDATTVFWAEADNPAKAEAAENTLAAFLDPRPDDDSETDKLRSVMNNIAQGKPLRDLGVDLDDDTFIYVLGLAPNASRLSVRFWEVGTLSLFAERLTRHYEDLILEPRPWKHEPGVWRLLLETAPRPKTGNPKADDIQPQLAGEMTRSILTGRRYPRSLLTNIVMRLRADGHITDLRVALCKAVLSRDRRLDVKGIKEEVPVSLDINNTSPGYRLGRLFSVLENIQISALGKSVNATIRDRYYGAASATPASIFPVLLRNSQHHLSRLRKDKPGLAVNLERDIQEIVDGLPAQFPKSLRIEAQGQFAIGYYHQSKARYTKQSNSEEGEAQ
ncbi:type I-C CRISPR-associated protein Cas8c/Csd1 [Saccharospirillum salsuginis]|uniref:Type I-C CRISPR-associated protein Cas8c/Csd1 n=1 Tax=Saccharospirillum salsuginis TaxID=418750 RepID=A0A918NBN4_9GAMM|nr:type I-C CRISPR-associated protein Cas8c/Csd1 [Saccharospirillum salsuginis]GGX56664.1 type I-C CRISPR-associated protein Cas8c/Csd1 [Saccharospirillum salsuginis]